MADRCYQKDPPSPSPIKERLPNTSKAMYVYYCITASHFQYWEELPKIRWYFVSKYFESQTWCKWPGAVTLIYLDMMPEALPILHIHIEKGSWTFQKQCMRILAVQYPICIAKEGTQVLYFASNLRVNLGGKWHNMTHKWLTAEASKSSLHLYYIFLRKVTRQSRNNGCYS